MCEYFIDLYAYTGACAKLVKQNWVARSVAK